MCCIFFAFDHLCLFVCPIHNNFCFVVMFAFCFFFLFLFCGLSITHVTTEIYIKRNCKFPYKEIQWSFLWEYVYFIFRRYSIKFCVYFFFLLLFMFVSYFLALIFSFKIYNRMAKLNDFVLRLV